MRITSLGLRLIMKLANTEAMSIAYKAVLFGPAGKMASTTRPFSSVYLANVQRSRGPFVARLTSAVAMGVYCFPL